MPQGVKISARGICQCGRAIHLRTMSLAQHEANRAPRKFEELTLAEKILANLSRTLDLDDFFGRDRQAAKGKNHGRAQSND